MKKNVLLCGALAIALSAAGSSVVAALHPASAKASSPAKPVLANGATLPQTNEYAALQTSCQICHSFDMITTQRLSAKTWKAEVTKMIKFGAPLPKSSEPAVVAYLAKYLGPSVPRSEGTRTETAPAGSLTHAP